MQISDKEFIVQTSIHIDLPQVGILGEEVLVKVFIIEYVINKYIYYRYLQYIATTRTYYILQANPLYSYQMCSQSLRTHPSRDEDEK